MKMIRYFGEFALMDRMTVSRIRVGKRDFIFGILTSDLAEDRVRLPNLF